MRNTNYDKEMKKRMNKKMARKKIGKVNHHEKVLYVLADIVHRHTLVKIVRREREWKKYLGSKYLYSRNAELEATTRS